MSDNNEITKDLTIMEVLQRKPQAVQVFVKFGMPCMGCMIAPGETVEEAAQAHGLDVEELTKALNQA